MGKDRNIVEAAVITTQDLTKTFGRFQAIRGISLEIREGESVAILGPNGAGKTTLLKILATIMKPSSGELYISGLSIKDKPEDIRRKIGVVTHQTYLYNNLTCFENLDFYCRMYDVPKKRIDEVIEMVDMRLRLHDRVGTLSRGMQQRVSIARSILHKPSIIILDEPETGLDQKAISTLWEIFKGTGEHKRTVVMTTHNIANGLSNSDRVIILNKGLLVYKQPSSGLALGELMTSYDTLTGEDQ